MKCQCCNKSATIHITEINSGQRVEMHLCEECAQKEGIAVKNQIPLNELLSTLLAVQSDADQETALDSGAEATCSDCGMTMKKFRNEGLLGCPNDYDVFDKKLKNIIENSQGGNDTHKGKVPESTPEETKIEIEISQLEKQLAEAVRIENYEAAAELRDKIAKLKNETD